MNKGLCLVNMLRARLGEPVSSGNEYTFECPKCSNGKRKLGVNLQKFLFNCFRCHWGGALTDLLEYLGIEIDFNDHKVPARITESRADAPPIPSYEPINGFSDDRASVDAIEFIRYRSNLVMGDVTYLRLGTSRHPRLYGRLIVPVSMSDRTKIVYYLARSYGDMITPKEVGPMKGDGFYPRSSVAYGFPELPGNLTSLTIVEGFWDWVALWKAGIPAVALLGSSLSDEVLGHLLSVEPGEVNVFMDGDDAGEKATHSICGKIRSRSRVRINVVR